MDGRFRLSASPAEASGLWKVPSSRSIIRGVLQSTLGGPQRRMAQRTRLRRMILHIQHHESHLLTVLAELVSGRVLTESTNPLNIFLQTRPFSGSLLGAWVSGLLLIGNNGRAFEQTRSLRNKCPLSIKQNARTTRLNRLHTQECKVCMLWCRKLNKQWTICLKMCRVPFSLPWQTYSQLCGLVCVAWLLSLAPACRRSRPVTGSGTISPLFLTVLLGSGSPAKS